MKYLMCDYCGKLQPEKDCFNNDDHHKDWLVSSDYDIESCSTYCHGLNMSNIDDNKDIE